MTTEPLFDRQRAALGEVQTLVRDRAAAEAAIAERYQDATATAEATMADARRSIAAARSADTDEQAQEHADIAAATAAKYDDLQATADQQRFDYRKKMVDDYSVALDKKRTEYKDKLWTIDSVLEADEKEAQDRYDDLRRQATSATHQADAIWAKADAVLARVGLDQTKIEPADGPSAGHGDPADRLRNALTTSESALARLKSASTLRLLGIAGTLGLVVIAGVVFVGIGFGLLDWPANLIVGLIGAAVGGGILRIIAGVLAKNQVKKLGMELGRHQVEVSAAVVAVIETTESGLVREREAATEKHATGRDATDTRYQPKIADLEQKLAATLAKIEDEHARVTRKVGTGRAAEETEEQQRYDRVVGETTARHDRALADAEQTFAEASSTAVAERDAAWGAMADAWHSGLARVTEVCRELTDYGQTRFPDWPTVAAADRALPADAPVGVRFGEYAVDLDTLPDGTPIDARLAPREPIDFSIPAFLPFSQKCSVVIKARDHGRPAAVTALQAMMLRFLTGLPPGKVRFTVIDPVGLGENFAAFMHLADFDEKLIGSRIWTEPAHIEKRLADLTEHMENVIQKYLRNQYKSIEEYNTAAGEVAEPYRVLVIANFPTNFSPDAARRLVSIMSSGPACGVCTLVGVDTGFPMPRDFHLADLEQVAFTLNWKDGRFTPDDDALAPFPLAIDTPPSPGEVAALVNRVGEASRDAARVEVPFDFIMPAPEKVWAGSAARGFDVAIGRAGATGRQLLSLGKGTAQHALIAGKTGSGKSTLLHALITNLALNYSPDEAELYLIDFKKGVEFKTYAEHRLPHARVVAIESEREFGMSVLQRLDGIMKERGEAFRVAGVNDLGGFREARPNERCPRIMLIVDEFQEFFVEDDKLAQECALLLDRLVRQGRAFGVHILLGSQTLGGAFSLARSTIDQMAVRIALQCSEADAQLILSKDNTAARLLNRPGDAIYNDANGMVEGNDPFQVVWLNDDKREALLEDLRKRSAEAGRNDPPPLVFEGSASADLTETQPLTTLIEATADAVPSGPTVLYLGDPVAIKEPTEVVIRPQSGANVLFIGQQEESALALMTAGIVSLAARYRTNTTSAAGRPVTVIDGTPDDSEYANYLANAAGALGLDGAVVDRTGMSAALAELTAEFHRRQSGESADRSPRFLLVHGLHRLRELRKADDDFGFGRKSDKPASPGENFTALLRDGPPVGIHCVVWCDSLTNLQRAVDRQGLREFALRVLFQMSAADSSHLLDTPIASRLGRSRALYVEEGGERPEKFRPYGLPHGSWLRTVGEKLAITTTPAPVEPSEPPAEDSSSTNGGSPDAAEPSADRAGD